MGFLSSHYVPWAAAASEGNEVPVFGALTQLARKVLIEAQLKVRCNEGAARGEQRVSQMGRRGKVSAEEMVELNCGSNHHLCADLEARPGRGTEVQRL